MAFRRPKDVARDRVRWREFVHGQSALFDAAGLPVSLADHRTFGDFLMHGFVPMPGGVADGVSFDLDELSPEQRLALGRLVSLYLERFSDPGIDPAVGRLLDGGGRA